MQRKFITKKKGIQYKFIKNIIKKVYGYKKDITKRQ